MTDCLLEAHFLKLTRTIEAHTGILLPPSKRSMIEGRLRKRMRAIGIETLRDYGTTLFDGGRLDEEFPHVVDCVTTNKTDFFREPEHFTFLRERAVPALFASRGTDRRLKIWSAASSIGAEAFTIAMALDDLGKQTGGFEFFVLGTDISHAVVEQARQAVFPTSMIDPVPPAFRKRYLMMSADRARPAVRIVPELRRRTRFLQLNLMDASYPFDRDIDVIFCRNILIYFDRPTQQAVLSRLCGHLRTGGYLILGHSETSSLEDRRTMQQIGPSVFQKGRVLAARAA